MQLSDLRGKLLLSEGTSAPHRKFLTLSDKDNLFTIDHFPLWYRLAVENTPGKFYYYPVNDKGLVRSQVHPHPQPPILHYLVISPKASM